ncbi:hypothetical protein ACJX0J_030255, partial [Zea mays]
MNYTTLFTSISYESITHLNIRTKCLFLFSFCAQATHKIVKLHATEQFFDEKGSPYFIKKQETMMPDLTTIAIQRIITDRHPDTRATRMSNVLTTLLSSKQASFLIFQR